MEWMYILKTWITLYFSSNTTQRDIIQCNVLCRGKDIMKNFLLDVPFQLPTFKWLRELKQPTSTKAHFTQTFLCWLSRPCFAYQTLTIPSIPNGSLIVAKGKRRKNTNVPLRNLKKWIVFYKTFAKWKRFQKLKVRLTNNFAITLTRLCSNSSITSVAAISSWRVHLNRGKALIHTWQFGSFGITWFWCLYLFASLFLFLFTSLKLSRV